MYAMIRLFIKIESTYFPNMFVLEASFLYEVGPSKNGTKALLCLLFTKEFRPFGISIFMKAFTVMLSVKWSSRGFLSISFLNF